MGNSPLYWQGRKKQQVQSLIVKFLTEAHTNFDRNRLCMHVLLQTSKMRRFHVCGLKFSEPG